MKNSFTLDHLILSNYCETHNSGEIKISDLLQLDFDLQQELNKQRTSSSVSPKKGIIKNILNYSLSHFVLHTEKAGVFNILMN